MHTIIITVATASTPKIARGYNTKLKSKFIGHIYQNCRKCFPSKLIHKIQRQISNISLMRTTEISIDRLEYICSRQGFPWRSDRCLPKPIVFIVFSPELAVVFARIKCCGIFSSYRSYVPYFCWTASL